MKWLQWEAGRQNSGYAKMLIATSRFLKFDCYILRIPDEFGVPDHYDPSPAGYAHHRINILLNTREPRLPMMKAKGRVHRWFGGRIDYFRPDAVEHSVEPRGNPVPGRNSFILSIGWLKKRPGF